MITIVIDQSFSKCEVYEHICLENTKKIYIYAGKCDDQLQFKFVFEAPMVSTPDRFIDNLTMSPVPPIIVKKYSAKK